MEYIKVTNVPHMSKESIVLCIGNFDGLHRGHQYLFQQARQLLNEDDKLAVWTFPSLDQTSITPIAQKRDLLERQGIQKMYEVEVSEAYSKFTSETFILEYLTPLNVKYIVVGEGFSFGKGQASDVEILQQLCERIGVQVLIVPLLRRNDKIISSTEIREYIKNGQVRSASQLLGRNYSLKGIVAHGNKVGRTLGFPTANLDQIDEYVAPSAGVYMGTVERYDPIIEQTESWNCLISAGYRPTVGGKSYKVEAYLLDYFGDLYDQTISVSFVERMRGEINFASLDDLIVQMKEDERSAREAFGMPLDRQNT